MAYVRYGNQVNWADSFSPPDNMAIAFSGKLAASKGNSAVYQNMHHAGSYLVWLKNRAPLSKTDRIKDRHIRPRPFPKNSPFSNAEPLCR